MRRDGGGEEWVARTEVRCSDWPRARAWCSDGSYRLRSVIRPRWVVVLGRARGRELSLWEASRAKV